MDENFRDRFALRSAYLEKNEEPETPTEVQDNTQEEEFEEEDLDFNIENKWLIPLIIVAALLAALAGAAYLFYKRYTKRRDANRAGIDSEDIRTAIVSMFPYAVRWLGAANIDVQDKQFATLIQPISEKISEQYSNYFKSMYVLWREAAYSDHEMEEEKRTAMREFVDDTKEMVQTDMGFKDKVKTALKYAL